MPKEANQPPKTCWLYLLLAGVAGLWGFFWWFLRADPQRGTFGDMFGAVNALFSGLAFAALVYTVWMQRIELQLQRKELSLTRQELRGQKIQLTEQNATLVMQRFENTFFELLKVHGQIVESIDLQRDDGRTTKGRDCFRTFHHRLRGHFSRTPRSSKDEVELTIVRKVYQAFFCDHEHELSHYFRHLYHIIKFVKQSDAADKRRYTNFVRAQLSSYELAMLFYDGISEAGSEKFKPLLEEFAILKHLQKELLFDPSGHPAFYHSDAYDGRTLG